jgi:hypothetical protein
MNRTSLLYWNANGLRDRLEDIRDLLSVRPTTRASEHLDILTFVETKLDPDPDIGKLPHIQHYNWYSTPRRSNSGGIAFLVHEKMNCKRRVELDYNSTIDATATAWLELAMPHRSQRPVLIATVYLHPKVTPQDLTAALASITAVIDTHAGHTIYVIGDFNARDPSWGDTMSTDTAQNIVRFASTAGLHVLNPHFIPGRPTRPSTRTIIDLAFTNEPSRVVSLSIADTYGLESDHLPLRLDFAANPQNTQPRPTQGPVAAALKIPWRIHDDTDFSAYTATIAVRLLPHSGPIDEPANGVTAQWNIEQRYSQFINAVIGAATDSIGTRPHREHRPDRYWSYPGARMHELYNRYRASLRLVRSRPRDPQARAVRREARSQWQAARRRAMAWVRDEYKNGVEPTSRQLSWRGLRLALSPPRQPTLINICSTDGTIPRSPSEAMNNMASALQHAAIPPISSSIDMETQQRVHHFQEQYEQSNMDSLQWSITVSDVQQQCDRINIRRAYGSDNIHPAFLRYGGDVMHRALHSLYTYSYRHAVLPRQWTESLVVPIYKGDGGATDQAESYRPISLTSCVVRTMEHLVQVKLIQHISPHIHDYQYGFRPQHSTHHSIYHLLQSLYRRAEQPKSFTPVVFLDLKKAFDRVWHDGLLSLLPEHGVTGRIWLWLRAFLTNRRMCVISKDATSDWYTLPYGVPQGAVLSPTLFIIFINKLARMLQAHPLTCGTFVTLLLYADDGAFYPDTSVHDWSRRFRTGLVILYDWARRYCQEFHPKKTQIVWFTRQQHFTPPHDFALGSFIITSEKTYRYLGMHLDANFRWTTHCTNILLKAQKDTFKIRRLIDFELEKCMHFSSAWKICQAYLLPRWLYGVTFICASPEWIHRLQAKLASVIKKVLALPISTHTLSTLVEASILPFQSLIQYYIVRAAHNMAALPITHTARRMFDSTYQQSQLAQARVAVSQSQHPRTKYIRLMTDKLVIIEDQWNCMHTADLQIITTAAQQQAVVEWNEETTGGLVLKSVKTTFTRNHYLFHAQRTSTRLIARTRHNRLGHNESMYKMNHGRAGTTSTPHCPSCPNEPESISHLLLTCPSYQAHRDHIQAYLASVNLSFSLHVLLNEHWTDHDFSTPNQIKQSRAIIRHTSQYLREICLQRDFKLY